jgi:hypothetical protein
VRYRMTQLRERYGDRLDAPEFVRDLLVALAGDDDLGGGRTDGPS